jgi:hypothetical protein
METVQIQSGATTTQKLVWTVKVPRQGHWAENPVAMGPYHPVYSPFAVMKFGGVGWPAIFVSLVRFSLWVGRSSLQILRAEECHGPPTWVKMPPPAPRLTACSDCSSV